MIFTFPELTVPTWSVVLTLIVCILSYLGYRLKKRQEISGIAKNVTHLLFPYIRPAVYAISSIWATYLFVGVAYSGPSVTASVAVLMREFALTGLYLLFITLLPGIFSVYFPSFSLNALFVRARRSLGVSGFFFGMAHGFIGFFYNLSGNILAPLFLPARYQIALMCSFIAFSILFLMAVSSIDRVEKWLGPVKWKRLHRLIYWAIILIVIHAFLIGSHFTTPSSLIPKLTNIIALTLLILEMGATILRFWQQRLLYTPKNIWISIALICLVGSGFWVTKESFQKPYDPHSVHRKGYSKNYIIEVATEPKILVPNQEAVARITVRDKRNNAVVKKFQTVQEKLMHIVIVGRDLVTYQHIHPQQQDDGTFTVAFTLPKEGTYIWYVGYSPPDFLENLSVITVKTQNAPPEEANLAIDVMPKSIGDVRVSLMPTSSIPLTDTVDFSYVFDTTSGEPVNDIQTYLGAFGHLAIVSEDGKTYLHVHPIDVPISTEQLGGPRVRFSTFFQQKGKYKLFGQFKRGDKTFVVEHVIEVK